MGTRDRVHAVPSGTKRSQVAYYVGLMWSSLSIGHLYLSGLIYDTNVVKNGHRRDMCYYEIRFCVQTRGRSRFDNSLTGKGSKCNGL